LMIFDEAVNGVLRKEEGRKMEREEGRRNK
jgi:hypothetical protein